MFLLQRLNIFFACFFLVWVLQTVTAFSAVHDAPDVFFSIGVTDTEVTMVAKGISLEDLIERIKNDISVEIKGLTLKPDNPVTFSHKGKSSEIVLRQLLRHLGEKNFAYEFSDDKLIRITVFPEGTQSAPIPAATDNKLKSDSISLVEIVDVLEETQAEKLDLKEGDYIYTYNGRRIFRHEELVEETFKDNGPTPVSMVIIRKGKLTRVFLDRGFIGIHVRTKLILKKELPADTNSWQ
jgi:hypothetical protein